MPSLKPCKRQVLIKKLKGFGFKGPYPGGKHSWMEKENIRLIIPNPHKGDIDVAQSVLGASKYNFLYEEGRLFI